MGFLNYLLYPWGFILQGLAIVHFIRRRPDTYWIFIILFLGPLGAIIYLLLEAAPDLGLLRQSFKFFPRRRRIRELEFADSPAPRKEFERLAQQSQIRRRFKQKIDDCTQRSKKEDDKNPVRIRTAADEVHNRQALENKSPRV